MTELSRPVPYDREASLSGVGAVASSSTVMRASIPAALLNAVEAFVWLGFREGNTLL